MSAQPGADDPLFVLGSSRRVPLRDVEPGLTDLWRLTGEEAVARGGPGVVRVRELNLIIIANSAPTASRVSNVVAQLSKHHPGRVVVLLDERDEAADQAPDAWVSAACYMNYEGGRSICWEQVTIPTRGAAADRLGTMANPYLVPDIPVCTWWPDDVDIEGTAFAGLVDISDKVILDSAGFRDAPTGLAALASLATARGDEVVVADLTWGRLTAWREMVAGMFDDPRRRSLLPRLDRVTVVYGEEDAYLDAEGDRRRPASARALLLVAWLATRLGWSLGDTAWEATGEGRGIRLQSELGFPVHVDLVPRPYPECTFGGLHAVELAAGAGRADEVVLSVARATDTCVCSASVLEAGRECVNRTVELATPDDAELLCQELDYTGVDRVFVASLLLAATLASLPGAEKLEVLPAHD